MISASRQSPLASRLLGLTRFGLWLLPLTALIATRESQYAYTLGKATFFRLLVEVALPVYVAAAFLDRRFRPDRSLLTWAVAGYAAAVQLTALMSLDRAQSWWGTLERMDGAFATLHFLALYLLLVGAFRILRDWRVLFHLWLASSVPVAILAASAHFIHNSPRPGSTLGGSTYLATYALFQIFYGACLLAMERSRWGRLWGGLGVALNLFTLWLTATRGAILGLGAGLATVAVLLLVYEYRHLRLRVAAALALFFLMASPLLIRLGRGSALLSRNLALDRLSVLSRNDATTQTRLILLGVSWKAFRARPLQGYGPEMFLVAYSRHLNPRELTYEQGWFDHAHNKLADVAVMEGLIGLLPYLAIFIAAGVTLLRSLGRGPERPLLMAAFGMLIAYFVQNLFLFDSPVSSILFYSLLAFLVTLTRVPDPAAVASPVVAKGKKRAPSVSSRLTARQRWAVALVALIMLLSAYVNLKAFAQAESAADLSHAANAPAAFEEDFRRILSDDAWPTQELIGSAADELAGSSAVNTPAFSSAARTVTAAMESRAATRRVLDPRFFISLGTLYNELSAADPSLGPRAEAALRKAIELAPRWPDTYDALALTDLVAGRTDAALGLLKQAVDLNPDNGLARWYYALVLIDRGREQEGFQQLSAALVNYHYHNPRDLERLAHVYYKAHDLPNARRFQQELVALQPENAAHHAALAELYKESGDPADALREIGIAASLDGSYAAGAEAFEKSLKAAGASQ
jgi:O-antigen ligase/Tfp pilus assembly protein PilF